MSHAVIVAHGQPSDPEPAEAALAELAIRRDAMSVELATLSAVRSRAEMAARVAEEGQAAAQTELTKLQTKLVSLQVEVIEPGKVRADQKTVEEQIAQARTTLDELQAQNTEGVTPMAHPMDAIQTLRSDEITEANQRQTLMSNAPAAESGLFLVPKVID